MPDSETLAEISSCWDIRYGKTRPDLRLAGSPERTEYRAVVEDEEGGLWVLERIAPSTLELKRKIIRTLAFLHDQGLGAVHPYRTNRENESIAQVGGDHWQVVPYVGGTSLPRPGYVQDRWRGKACAGFLLDLRDKAREVPFFDRERPFSIMVFIRDLSDKPARHAPDLFKSLRPVVEILEQAFTAAIRFTWLSDWLRRGDREMIGLETSYIQLLMKNRKSILARWRP